MRQLNKDDIIKQYEESGKIMYEATLSGDYKANNREGAKMTRIFKRLEKDSDLAHACIAELLESDNVVVRTKAAAYCLALEINILEAERILQEIRDNPENRIFGFNAGMVLEVWKKDGKLSIYQKRITTDCIWRWKMAVKKGEYCKKQIFCSRPKQKR